MATTTTPVRQNTTEMGHEMPQHTRRRRDVIAMLSLPLIVAIVALAQISEGGTLRALLQPTAALIVFGGTLAAMLLSVGDLGRFRITHDPADKGRFRTPSLRDVTNTAPSMHTGAFSLQGVLNMYNAGMATLKRQPFERDDPTFPVKSPLLKPLGLNRQDLADLEAFLGALAEPTGPARTPATRDSE